MHRRVRHVPYPTERVTLPGKRAASDRSRNLIKLLPPGAAIAAIAAIAALAIGSGVAIASVAPAADPASQAASTQPRTTERVSRDDRPPHRTAPASPAASPSPSRTRTKAPRVASAGACGTSFYDEPQGTANGERFNPDALTAAHKSLPFNTRVRVINPRNGKSVVVRINDRGPYIDGRCLDLSRAAFDRIAPLDAGVIHAKYEVLA
ncbi:MAG: septal ring lytic transglycosylase RlpA family protein [Micromonosporaceae bacterium]|nr:septal ring lytic transglycosylase RlpA family protein [Micromonosporaceae bacterium]